MGTKDYRFKILIVGDDNDITKIKKLFTDDYIFSDTDFDIYGSNKITDGKNHLMVTTPTIEGGYRDEGIWGEMNNKIGVLMKKYPNVFFITEFDYEMEVQGTFIDVNGFYKYYKDKQIKKDCEKYIHNIVKLCESNLEIPLCKYFLLERADKPYYDWLQ
jgi:hypothetical protein